jgi:hypothetical protein
MGVGRIVRLTLLAAASLLAGCAADSRIFDEIMVVPGYYDTLDCPELLEKLRSLTARVRELILLMEKSGQDSGGAIVNAIAYDTEYAKARAAREQAEEAAVWKRCDLSAEPSISATGPKTVNPPR